MRKPPSLRNNNGTLQVRVRIDGKDAFINRLGRWSDPVAVAKAHAIAAQIWSDYQQGTFDRSLMAYQPLLNGKEVGLLPKNAFLPRNQPPGHGSVSYASHHRKDAREPKYPI